MKIKKIYLDMDGVICDFEKKYKDICGKSPMEARDSKEFSPLWTKFIRENGFEKIDWYPGGQELIRYIKSLKVPVEILSSSGGQKYHGEVTAQKVKWLRKHGISYKANIVPGRRLKKDYAEPGIVLIDDTNDVIESFNDADGIGILHKNVGDTVKRLKDLLAE